MHAALASDLLVLDYARKLLAERSVGGAMCDSSGYLRPAAASSAPADSLALVSLAASMHTHTSTRLQNALASAVADLFTSESAPLTAASVTAVLRDISTASASARSGAGDASQPKRPEAVKPRPAPPTWLRSCNRTVPVGALRTIANSLAFLHVRVLADAALTRLRTALEALRLPELPTDGDNPSSTSAAMGDSPSFVSLVATVQASLQLLAGVDSFGRSPVYIAATLGNADAAAELSQAMLAAVNETAYTAEIIQLQSAQKGAPKALTGKQRDAARKFGELTAAAAVEAAVSRVTDTSGRDIGTASGPLCAGADCSSVGFVVGTLLAQTARMRAHLGGGDQQPLPTPPMTAALHTDPTAADQQEQEHGGDDELSDAELVEAESAGAAWSTADAQLTADASATVLSALRIARARAVAQAKSAQAALSPFGASLPGSGAGVVTTPVAPASAPAADVDVESEEAPLAACDRRIPAVYVAGLSAPDPARPLAPGQVAMTVTPQQFAERFILANRPALLPGLARRWPMRAALVPDRLLREHGDVPFPVAPVPYAGAFGGEITDLTLAQYAERVLRLRVRLRPAEETADKGAHAGADEDDNDDIAVGTAVTAPKAEKLSSATHTAAPEYIFDAPGADASGRRAAPEGGALPRWLADPLAARLLTSARLPLRPAFLRATVPRYQHSQHGAIGWATDPAAADGEEVGADKQGLSKALLALTDALASGFAPTPAAGGAALQRVPLLPMDHQHDSLGNAPANDSVASVSVEADGSSADAGAGAQTTGQRPAPPPVVPPLSQHLLPPPKPQFYLGPPGSGAPMHLHKDAVNALAHGRKRWWLLPPGKALYSSVPISHWLTESFPESAAAQGRDVDGGSGSSSRGNSNSSGAQPSQPSLPSWASHALECTQGAGDVMYVPRGWGHAVLNTRTSVGFALEFATAEGLPF